MSMKKKAIEARAASRVLRNIPPAPTLFGRSLVASPGKQVLARRAVVQETHLSHAAALRFANVPPAWPQQQLLRGRLQDRSHRAPPKEFSLQVAAEVGQQDWLVAVASLPLESFGRDTLCHQCFLEMSSALPQSLAMMLGRRC
jgi:hypothetical protein